MLKLQQHTFLHRLNIDRVITGDFHPVSGLVLVDDEGGNGCWFDGSTPGGASATPDAASQRRRSIHPFFDLRLASPHLCPSCSTTV